MPQPSASFFRTIPPAAKVTVCVLLLLSIWAFWPTLTAASDKWIGDPQYSHGYLVPLFAIVLLVLRARDAEAIQWRPRRHAVWLFAAALLLRLVNVLTWNIDWLDGAAFVLSIGGTVYLVGGKEAIRWAWPAVAFLLFMLPLPYRVERELGGELQAIATRASTGLMQMIGLPASSEGNVIHLYDRQLGVAEACSGLSMLLIFVALAVAFAVVIDRPVADRLVLVASAVPIALLANILRIAVTGALHVWVGSRIADLVFHDLAGWLMMPMALATLWLEARFLTYVITAEPSIDVSRSETMFPEPPVLAR